MKHLYSILKLEKWLGSIVVCCSFVLFISPINAQTNFNFEYLDISNGLSHNTVFTILQDRHGYVWLGTQDGLVRYDSKKTKVYKPSNENNIKGKNIQCLIENKDGDLYIGTRGSGIIVRSGRTGIFEPLTNEELEKALSKSWIKHLIIDNQERLWISTLDNGLWVYDLKKNNYQNFTKENSLLNSHQISSTVQDHNGNIWIASSSNEIFIVKNGSTTISKFDVQNTRFFGFRKTLYCDKKGRVWLGTEGHGLFLLNLKNRSAKSINVAQGLSSNIITHLLEWEDNKLLIATDGGGLNILDLENEKIQVYKIQEGKYPLNTNALYYLHIDKDQNLWIGTYNGGVNISKNNKMVFETYQFQEQTTKNKTVKSVLSIAKSTTNKLWIGTDGDGVYEFDLSSKSMNDKNTLFDSHNKIIKAIYEDTKGNLWIGVYNEGLIKYNLKTKKSERFFPNQNKKTSINGWNVWTIAEDKEDNIWIGILGGGINKISNINGEITSYTHSLSDSSSLSGDGIMVIKFDSKGNGWIGTNTTGLNFLNKSMKGFKRIFHDDSNPHSLSANDIRSIFQDSKNRIWIGTESGGLNLLLRDHTFKNFTTAHGLISNAILGITEDGKGNLWISSFNGISRFDLDKKFQNFNFHQNFSMQTNQFNMMSAYSDSTYSAFGGINGLSIFKPLIYKTTKTLPTVIFTDFKIFNKSVDTTKLINKELNYHSSIEEASKVTLFYSENTFSFQFVAIDFIDEGNIGYEYIMEGFDKEWSRTNNQQNEVTYTNLDPGTYTFKVRAFYQTSEFGLTKQMEVHILPLFWQTWWFRICILISLISLIGYILKTYIDNREMALNQAVLESNEQVLMLTNDKLKIDQKVLNLQNEKLEMEISSKNTDLLSQTAKIAHKNEVLLNIKKLIQETDESSEKSRTKFIRNLNNLIESELEDKKNWERFQQYFDQINQNFRSDLLEKHPSLTQTDLLICTLSKLNLSNKEMALLLNLSIPAIEKSRYRLKKRLNLPIDKDLNGYLRSI